MKSVLLLLALFFSFFAGAQTAKTDKIFLKNGSVIEVNIRKVSATTVEFVYPNETVQNEEPIDNIKTIVFSSGRMQQFGNSVVQTQPAEQVQQEAVYQAIQPNTLAILPVAFYDKATGTLWEDKSKLAQSRIYDFFEDDLSRIAPLKLQDTRTTNASLRKAKIDYTTLDETPVEDLEKILGTEYLVLSKVTCEVRAKSTLNETSVAGAEKKGNKNVAAVHTTSSTNEERTYYYMIVLEIYKGTEKIYNETRKPFLNMEDSWKDAMEYLLKRTPVYRRK